MFNKNLIIGAIASCATTLSFAQQSDIPYTYAGIAYETMEIGSLDLDGFSLFGSAAINESVFVLGGYSAYESDKFNSSFPPYGSDEVELTEFNFGLGFHTPLAPTTDFLASLLYLDQELESRSLEADGNGYRAQIGLRSMPVDQVEFDAFVYYEDVEDESDTGFSFSARFYPTPQFAVGLGYDTLDEIDTLSLEARFNIN